MDHIHVTAWMDGYKRSWEEQDADTFVTLFTGDAVYLDTPFAEPLHGPDFHADWIDLATRQSDNRFDFKVMAVTGDMAVVNWWGTTTCVPSDMLLPGMLASTNRDNSRQRSKGDGIFVLYFQDDGRCRELREWQHWIPVKETTED